MAPNPWGWCKSGSDQLFCYQNHVYDALPAGPNGGKNRRCPVCGGNLAVNRANIPNQWLLITCHGEKCPRLNVRDALVNDVGIDARCLGLAGFEDRPGRPGADAASLISDSPAARAAIRRSYVHAKLADADIDNPTLLKLAISIVAASDGNLPGDIRSILPGTQAELAAALRARGIDNSHACKLARNYFRKQVA
jgi:hypothetical protein